ncbi:MAG: hypothetical protein EXR64_02515 [Dehalococcoidia bacterium]|nr:hypothetical protein [Dehalococcoidia bacterium]
MSFPMSWARLSWVRPLVAPLRLHDQHVALLILACAALWLGAGCSAGSTAPPAGTSTAAPREAPTPPVARLTFMAGFRPQANLPFVAAYVAKERGFFAEEQLDVDIQHASGADEHLKLLLEGRVQFVTGTAAQALRRAHEGLPTVAVALFGQRGDQGFVVRADSNIKVPADFKGRTVGFKSGVVPAEFDALLKTAGLGRRDVRLVAVGFDPREFIDGKVEVYPVFLDNEPDLIRKAGLPIRVIDPQDHGVPTLGLTYLAHRDTLTKDRRLVERFLRATLRGVRWTQEHPDEAVEITLKYAPGADRAHQRFLLGVDLENAARADGIGRGSAAQWQGLADLLTTYGVLSGKADASKAWDGTIVDELYRANKIR